MTLWADYKIPQIENQHTPFKKHISKETIQTVFIVLGDFFVHFFLIFYWMKQNKTDKHKK